MNRETKQSIVRFLNNRKSNGDRAWFEDDSIRVYLRYNVHRSVIDIANVATTPQGTGEFTRFLEWIESIARLLEYNNIKIENVLEPRFQAFLERKGYTKDNFFPPSLHKMM